MPSDWTDNRRQLFHPNPKALFRGCEGIHPYALSLLHYLHTGDSRDHGIRQVLPLRELRPGTPLHVDDEPIPRGVGQGACGVAELQTNLDLDTVTQLITS